MKKSTVSACLCTGLVLTCFSSNGYSKNKSIKDVWFIRSPVEVLNVSYSYSYAVSNKSLSAETGGEINEFLELAQLETNFVYDARGRLVRVSKGDKDFVVYTLDDAGNRVNITREEPKQPKITYFYTPSSSTRSSKITISWRADDAVYCDVKMSDGSLNLKNQAASGSVKATLRETLKVWVECFNGSLMDSKSRLVRVKTGGGLPIN